jgi:hypothetical protein
MHELGNKLGSKLFAGDLILLSGPLGAGKTALTQGIGLSFGISEITSPTFVISKIHNGRIRLVHVDAYRLQGQSAAIFDDLDLGIIERVDIIGKTTEKGDKYNRVFIHFKTWFAGGNAEVARVRLLSGKDIKIIYDEPWFWKISAYRERDMNQRPVKTYGEKKATIVIDSDIKIAPGLTIKEPENKKKVHPHDNRNHKKENFKKVKKEDNNNRDETTQKKKARELIKYSGIYGPSIEMNGGICMDLPKKKQTNTEKVNDKVNS